MHSFDIQNRNHETRLIIEIAGDPSSLFSAKDDAKLIKYGWHKRSKRDLFEVMLELAELQIRYDATTILKPREISFRAVLLILPLCGDTPEKRARTWWERVVPFYVAAASRYPKSPIMPMPRLTLRARRKNEHFSVVEGAGPGSEYARKAEIVGHAVVKEYRKHNGQASMESCYQAVAEQKIVGGVEAAGHASVRRYYKFFRRAAFKRQFADWGAVMCQREGKPWPDDQVWLSDFPQMSEG